MAHKIPHLSLKKCVQNQMFSYTPSHVQKIWHFMAIYAMIMYRK